MSKKKHTSQKLLIKKFFFEKCIFSITMLMQYNKQTKNKPKKIEKQQQIEKDLKKIKKKFEKKKSTEYV